MMKNLLKFVVFPTLLFLNTFGVIAQINTYTGTSGSWNTASNWSLGVVPTASHDVVIPALKTVTVSAAAFAKSVTVMSTGVLTINNTITLTVYGNVTVNSGGQFNAGLGNSDSATIKVYGNFSNQGTANFWKSSVVIAGDLFTSSTILQNNGDILVGGNVIATISGSGNGFVYPVNPVAVVTVTGTSNAQSAGTLPTDPALVALMNEVIYGGTCPFTISDIASLTICVGGTAVFVSGVVGVSPSFQWQVNDGTGWVDLVNGALYSGVMTSSLSITGVTALMTAYRYRTKVTIGGCTKNGNYGVLSISSGLTISTQPINQLDCEGASVSFNAAAVGSGLTYTWQYKKPTDVSFIAMPATNVTYPTVGKVTIANVGSTQFPDGTQFRAVVSNGSCSVTSNSAILSVNSITGLTASPAATPSITNILKCYGGSNSYTVTTSYPSNVVSYQWKKSVAIGVWNNVSNGGNYAGATTATLTISNGTAAESAEYRVYITFNNSTTQCSVDSSTRTRLLTFLPELTTPQTIVTNATCSVTTGAITVAVQSATDVYSFDNGLNYQASNIKSGLATGNYAIIIKNIGGCLSPSVNVPINGLITNTWNGSSWSTGSAPSGLTINGPEKIVFAGNYTATTDLLGCSCEVQSGSITFLSGKKLTITNDLKVIGGSLTFEDSASLVQINAVANSGDIRYRRQTQSAISNFDYTYWSSPVSPQTLFNVSPLTLGDKYFSFNGASDSWVQEASSTVMGAGIGYIIRGPQSFMAPSPPSFYQATFIGVPNNGTISIPIGTSGESSYLLGNPYPSALDGETFIKNNSILDGTLYFWTHGTKIGTGTSNLGSGLYAYTSDDYASFNLTGGAAASSGGAIPTGKIGSGQGFFVTTVGSGSVNFANTMRVGVGGIIGNNSQFFKTQPSAKTTALEKNRLWLDFFNEEGAFKQALIGYVSGASNDLDMQYDGESFDANEYVDFYSILNNKNLVIQGRAVPFDQEDKVILGFKTTIEGEFTIKIKQFDGLFDTQDVFIEDKLLKIKHDLKKEGYTFTTAKGTFDDRFVLFYANAKGITTTTDLDVVAKLVYVSTTNKDIKIASSTANIEAVKIFDLSGKEVFNKQKINSTDLSIRTLRQGNTVYVVKIKLDNGQTLTQKVIY